MITNNFKALVACLLQSVGDVASKALVECKDTSGVTAYMANTFSRFPKSADLTVSITGFMGIFIGSGSTPASENDYKLDQRITSGIQASSVTRLFDTDENNNPFIQMLFTLTNTSNEAITVSEMGYVQSVNADGTKNSSVSSSTYKYFLFDRTVLATPIVLEAGESAAIKYTLKTIMPV